MAKTKISEFSATPANNTDIDNINIAEGCAPSGINDAIRELMSQLKDFQTGAVGDSFNGPVGTTTAAAGAFTTLTTSSTVTLNGGTANGVPYLNGSKVLTTGSALTFDGSNFSTTGQVIAGGDLKANSTGTGNVGLNIARSGGTTADWHNYIPSGSADLVWYKGSELMRLTSTGLGIGTSSPGVKLHAAENSSGGAYLRLENTRTSTFDGDYFGQVQFNGNDTDGSGTRASIAALCRGVSGQTDMVFSTSPAGGSDTERMRLNSSGNLGLGVTPSAWANGGNIQLGGANIFANIGITYGANAYYNSGFKYITTGYGASYQNQVNGQHQFFTSTGTGTAGNAISFTQSMTLNASGSLCINTTSPLWGNERLAVNGILGGVGQAIYANGTSSIGLLLYSAVATGATAGKQISFVRNDGVEVGSITSNGSTTLYNTTSDQRLKVNIQDAAPAAALIDSLQVRQYDWKADGLHQRYGFIAQELVTVAPEAVHQPADPEEMMAVDYSKLVPMLVKEIQSLRKRLAAAGI